MGALSRGCRLLRRREPPELDAYLAGAHARRFVCDLAAGAPQNPHALVYEDERTIAFLNRFLTVEGYTLVAPREHREQVTRDFTADEFLALQHVLYRVGEAVRRAMDAERVYLLPLGSQQANRHVHWHVVPCPVGLPFERQQLAPLDRAEGILEPTPAEQEEVAARIRAELG